MKLIFIRHGDPDYENDSLTEKGRREAELLRPVIKKINADEYYTSPQGRARLTASLALSGTDKEPAVLPYMREFNCPVFHHEIERTKIPWDFLPEDIYADERALSFDRWHEIPLYKDTGIKAEYDRVTGEFEKLLSSHGYERCGRYYAAKEPNAKTLVFFCHFGVTCVILSRLINISPVALWHGTAALTTSVTTVVTEERRKGKASFRVTGFGDLSHLYASNEPPSFSARFCEVYGDGTRQD